MNDDRAAGLSPAPLGLLRRLADGTLTDDELELFTAYLETDGLVAPPAEALRRAQHIPRAQRPSLLERVRAQGRLLEAVLRGDSGIRPVLAGTRGTAATRYLTFGAEETSLELEIATLGGGRQSVVGQLEGGEWRTATLETESGETADAPIDAAGMFAFPAAGRPRGLLIRGEGGTIVVEIPGG